MTLVIAQNDAEVSNAATIEDAPAVRITGTGVRFTNTESGRLISTSAGTAALIIEASGANVVNELGGIISAYPDNAVPSGVAIQGLAGNDTITSYGRIAGDVSLGPGNDRFTQAGFYAGSDSVDLGAGDDFFAFQQTKIDSSVQEVHGGEGQDTLRLIGGAGAVRAGIMSGIEALEISRDLANVVGFSGFSSVTLEPGSINNLIGCANPDADLVVRAGPSLYFGDFGTVTLNQGTTFRSVTGTDGREGVTFASAAVFGDIALGGGDDGFSYQPADFGKPNVAGVIDGGTGRDTFQILSNNHYPVDLSAVEGFEALRVDTFSSGPIILDVFFASGFDTIAISSGVHARLYETELSTAAVTLASQTRLGIDRSSGVGSITLPYPEVEVAVQGDLAFSVRVDNAGSITGDVRFAIGDDLYDGRHGSLGGTVYGFAGNDRLLGGAGDERFDGGSGADLLDGGGGNDLLVGGSGADTLSGGAGDDLMIGGAGNDVFFIDSPGDRVAEASDGGRDVAYAGRTHVLDEGAHIEIFSTADLGGTQAINLSGNALAQEIYGNAGANALSGGGGADVLVGLGGDDAYFISDGSERIIESSGQGRDIAYFAVSHALAAGVSIEIISTASLAGAGAINLTGNELAQEIYGNAGVNVLRGGGGADVLLGLGGDDVYFIDSGGEIIVEGVGQGRDVIYTDGTFALNSGAEIEVISARSLGGTGLLYLVGNEYGQELLGNAGFNYLDGGRGADSLVGGGNADTFAFTTALGGGNVDRILDFEAGLDRIGLDGAIFAGIGSGSFDANAFRLGATAQDAGDRIFYDQASGALYYDADGNGAGAAVLFAQLNAGTVLTASDFTVL